jgi:hypothetical protein
MIIYFIATPSKDVAKKEWFEEMPRKLLDIAISLGDDKIEEAVEILKGNLVNVALLQVSFYYVSKADITKELSTKLSNLMPKKALELGMKSLTIHHYNQSPTFATDLLRLAASLGQSYLDEVISECISEIKNR